MMDKEELKPCPFCGEEPIKYRSSTGVFYVGCNNNECFVDVDTSAWSEEGAIYQWNTRDTSYRDRVIEAVESVKVREGVNHQIKSGYTFKTEVIEAIKEVKP